MADCNAQSHPRITEAVSHRVAIGCMWEWGLGCMFQQEGWGPEGQKDLLMSHRGRSRAKVRASQLGLG